MTHTENNLILVVDDDKMMCSNISRYLQYQGYDVIVAHDGIAGLLEINDKMPALAIVDLQMPHLDGMGFLKELRSGNCNVPVIVTTGEPDMDSVINIIHHGAQDFIVKPFQLSDLHVKVEQILDTIRHNRKSQLLSDLVVLHSISNKLAASTDHDEVLDVTFEACLKAVNSQHGYLMLYDESIQQLSLVRTHGEYHGSELTSMNSDDEWNEAKWVCAHNRTVTVSSGVCDVPELAAFTQRVAGTMIVTPLRAADQVVGVICAEGLSGDKLNSRVGRSLLEILAAQAGTAIKNAGLYQTLNRKITDLNFIANYAEQFVGMVDPHEVLVSFLDTIRDYFEVDYLGVLLLKKRFHSFLYWSNSRESDELNNSVVEDAISCFNEFSKQTKINRSRVKLQRLDVDAEPSCEPVKLLTYCKTVPLIWEDFEFGSLVLKWEVEPEAVEANEKLLRGIINQTRFALTNAKLYADIKENYLRTIKALAIAVDAKDAYTHGHSENVMKFSEILAKHLNFSENDVERIKNGGLLHDIGKIGIPGYILNKPTPLTAEEFNGVMKTHPTLGANIIKDVPFLQELNPIILYHHENYDGSGYPLGLSGEEIPLDARIVHVADAYEAMTSNRPYRKSLGVMEAVRRLRESSGIQFDPNLVEEFITAMVKCGEIEQYIIDELDEIIDTSNFPTTRIPIINERRA